MKHSILLEVILTNQCNKRCEYCDLDFRNISISNKYLDECISLILRDKNSIWYLHINFFWWEPLLEFDKLRYFVDALSEVDIKFSIWTNGALLTSTKLDYLIKNDIFIHLSVDNITWIKDLKILNFINYKNIEINFIQDPDYLFRSQEVYKEILKLGVKKINFMPVFSTKKWNKNQMIDVWKILKYMYELWSTKIEIFWYYDWFSAENQFMLDTDWYLYNDVDSLLWLQKQYSAIDENLKKEINRVSKNSHIWLENLNFYEVIKNYNSDEVRDCILSIPKSQWYQNDYLLLFEILKNVQRKFWV